MKVCKEARKGARMLFDAVHTNGRLDESKIRTALSEVVARRPTFQNQILQEFHRLVRLEIESRSALVQTASELAEAEKVQVRASLQSRFGSDVLVAFETDSTLIAGIRYKVGSDVYDCSIRERLARLKSELSH